MDNNCHSKTDNACYSLLLLMRTTHGVVTMKSHQTFNIDNLGMWHQSPVYGVLANVVHCVSHCVFK